MKYSFYSDFILFQSPPANLATAAASSSSFNAEFTNVTSGIDTTGNASSSSFESLNYTGQQGSGGFSGFESAQGGGAGGIGSSYESNSFSSQGGGSSLGPPGTAGYQSYNASGGGNIGLAQGAFNAADINRDGTIDENEFRQFLGSNIQYV